MKLRNLLCASALFAGAFSANATVYTIGTGSNNLNQSGVSPFSNLYEDNRTQYLFPAAELTAAGATAGTINSLAFNFVSMSSLPAENVSIKMGMTSATTLSGITEGLTTVYTAASISPAGGWNTFTFTTPFTWDGVSNLIIEVCRDNNDFTNNYGVQGKQYPAGEFYTFSYYDDGTVGCNMTSGGTLLNANRRRRPNIQLDIVPATPCAGTPVAGLSATVTSVCATIPFGLTATPAYTSGLSYTYQVSTDGGATWSNVGPSTTIANYHIGSISATSQYRVIVTCTAGGADTSAAVTVNLTPASGCYCTPAYYNGCYEDDNIENFVLNGDGGTAINHLGSGCSTGGYGDFTAMSVTLTPGVGYPGTLSSSFPSDDEAFAIWVDWNQNGAFETSEVAATGMYVGGTSLGNFTITPPAAAAPGSYRMRVRLEYDYILTDACEMGDFGETHDYTIQIGGGCTTPVVDLGADIAGCTGDTLTLSAGNPGLSYLWSTGAATQAIQITETGTYSVTVTDGACAAADTLLVTFYEYPVVNLGADTALCTGDTLTLNAGNPGAIYAWSNGESTQTITVNAPGTYFVSVLNNVCEGADTIVISEVALPVAGTISVDDAASPGFIFSAPAAAGSADLQWDFGDGATGTDATVSHTYTANGTYTVTLTVTNACGDADSASVEVTVSGVGIRQMSGVAQIAVYPNPASGRTTVASQGAVIQSLEAVDHLGRIVYRSQPNAAQTTIDVKGMAKGVYTLRMQTTKGNTNVKLVVR